MRASVRAAIAAGALTFCAYAGAQTIVSRDGSSVSITNSVSSSNSSISSSTSSSVNSSVDSSTGSSTSTIVTNNVGGTSIQSNIQGEMSTCSIVRHGQRCEVSCTLPEVAQCTRGLNTTRPSCFCKTQ